MSSILTVYTREMISPILAVAGDWPGSSAWKYDFFKKHRSVNGLEAFVNLENGYENAKKNFRNHICR